MTASMNVEDSRQRMGNQATPFIGHAGVGSRISVKKTSDALILKESVFSQLMTLYGLLLFGPGLTAMVIAKRADDEVLKMPWPFMVVVGFFSLLGWIFAAKYFVRLAAGRRIEVSAADGTVSFFTAGRKPQRQVSLQEIEGFDILNTGYRSDDEWVANFTLRLKCRDGTLLELCISDSKSNIDSAKSSLESLVS